MIPSHTKKKQRIHKFGLTYPLFKLFYFLFYPSIILFKLLIKKLNLIKIRIDPLQWKQYYLFFNTKHIKGIQHLEMNFSFPVLPFSFKSFYHFYLNFKLKNYLNLIEIWRTHNVFFSNQPTTLFWPYLLYTIYQGNNGFWANFYVILVIPSSKFPMIMVIVGIIKKDNNFLLYMLYFWCHLK